MGFESTRPSLLSRVRDAADELAWREFEGLYGPLILGYCRRLGLQLADAEDVRQIVMTDLSKTLPGFHLQPARGKFRTYLGKVVKNAVSRYRRRHNAPPRALSSTILATTPESDASASDQDWEQEWILHHYRLAMQQLRSTYDARSLKVFDELVAGKTIANVASLFDATPAAIRKIKQRVKERLQELVAAQIENEDNPDAER